MNEGSYIANTDGGSRGNPGPAGVGVVVRDPSGRIVWELAEFIGSKTNNEAEYLALIGALDFAVENKLSNLHVQSDSLVMVNHVNGIYKCQAPTLQPLLKKALALVKKIKKFSIEHIRREFNEEADALANLAMDREGK